MKEYWVVQNENLHPQNQKILNEYLMSIWIQNMSKYTIMYRSWFLQNFLLFINKPVTNLTSDDILNWINEKCSDLKETTINWRLTVLSSFIKFCQEEEQKYIDESVRIKKHWRPKIPKPLPKYRDEEELARMNIAAEKQNLRDRTIYEFSISSGCRVGEVSGLEIEKVDLKNRTAIVVGKGKKVRQVHFNEKSAMLLEKLLENHPEGASTVFLNRFGKKMHERSFQNIIAKIGKKAGLLTKLTPHQLRHTFATVKLNKGADLVFISDELGHSSLRTTGIYARVLDERITELYRKYMG
ncbi:MAG: tyrosine-type recombinase/integrase [Clostridiaceae bacterium]|nr:tyrosine-type recombinase/integrase [Clostridiaceae bacterium]